MLCGDTQVSDSPWRDRLKPLVWSGKFPYEPGVCVFHGLIHVWVRIWCEYLSIERKILRDLAFIFMLAVIPMLANMIYPSPVGIVSKEPVHCVWFLLIVSGFLKTIWFV